VLTNGRLELGLGAGWLLADYQQTGLSFDAPGERLARLAETVQICKAFFTEETVTFHGKYYQIEALDAFPTTTQKPHPPIMIGGRQRRVLSLAARQADIVSISMLDPLLSSRRDSWMAWLRSLPGSPGRSTTLPGLEAQPAPAGYACKGPLKKPLLSSIPYAYLWHLEAPLRKRALMFSVGAAEPSVYQSRYVMWEAASVPHPGHHRAG
jgi:hypothetical protein